MLKINDKIEITCEPFEGKILATVLSVDEIGLEEGHLIYPGSGEQTLVIVLVKTSNGEIHPLIAEDLEDEGIGVSDLDWRYPSRVPQDVKVKIVEEVTN